jgi:anthranilate synthase/aminodeoxychorismate synthase-like glutamine amidotransferase
LPELVEGNTRRKSVAFDKLRQRSIYSSLTIHGNILSIFALLDVLAMLLMIDNYDSFTYNLVQYFGELGAEVRVVRNDAIDVAGIAALAPQWLVISPGPCTPSEAGVSVAAIQTFAGRIPILGVCLGHQAIGQAFGGHILHAREVMHGKLSAIHHANTGLFFNLPDPFQATRYHSLVIEWATLPECLEVIAWTALANGERDEIMGVRHRTLPVQGVQFHPESILTEHGHALLRNFLQGR